MTGGLDAIAARLAAGGRPTEAEAEVLAATRDVITLGMLADEDRQRRHGRRVTYVRVLDVPVADPAAWTSDLPASAREIRLSGRPGSVEDAVGAARALAGRGSGAALTGFALEDLAAVAAEAATPLGVVAERLREAGLEAVAGVSVTLGEAERAITDARAAGLAVWRLTVPRLDAGARLAVLRRAGALQRAVGGLRAFAPLAAAWGPEAPSTGYDDVKQVALARLLVDNVESIQVDWRGYGPKLAQVALTFGADDIDGVSPFDGRDLGLRRATIEEIHRNVRAASLEAVERDGRFAPVRA